MPQTIDYKVNVDLNEAMSTLQMVDMQMAQMGGGGGGYQPLPYHPGPVEQAFGDLSFSAGQFAQRFQQPLGTIQTFTPSSLSTMPHVNFATAATSVWNPSGLSVPHGIAAYDFQRHAEEQFAVQGGRAAAGFAWGAGKEIGLASGSLALGAAASAVGTPLLGAVVGLGSYALGSTVLAPVSGMLQDKAVIEDVVRHSSKLDRGSVHAVSNALTDLHLNDPLLTASDVTSIAGLGSQYGLMGDPASSSKEYLKNFRELASSAKEVATALGTSLQEGMATMAQLKGAGFSTSGAAGVVGQLHGMAGGDPAGIRALIGTGMMGASAFHGTGMARTGGFWQAIGTSGAVGGAMGVGDVSKEMWHQAGGKSGVTRLMLGSNMQFQQSGLGVALQAGLWQGGTDMAAYGGGDMFGLMAGGLGGMSSGDFLSFNRNRAEAVGKMGSRERMQLEAKTHMQMAEMMAEQMGGDVGDALFFMAQGQGMSTPHAQTWASSIQRISSGRFGGGGGQGRSTRGNRIRSRIRSQYDERNQRQGVDALVGGFRDAVGRFYNEEFVEPISALQETVGDYIDDRIAKKSPAIGDADIVEMTYGTAAGGGNLLGEQMRFMSGMDISEYEFAGAFRGQMRALGVEVREQVEDPGVGWMKAGRDKYYYAPTVTKALDEAKDTGDTAWGTGVDQVRNGRGGEASRIYQDIVRQHGSSAAGIRRVQEAFKKDGFGATMAHLGVAGATGDRRAAATAATRAFLKSHLGEDIEREDLDLFQTRQQVSVAAELGREDAQLRLRQALTLPYKVEQRQRGVRYDITRHKPLSEENLEAYGTAITKYLSDSLVIDEGEAAKARDMDTADLVGPRWESPDSLLFQPTDKSAMSVSRANAMSGFLESGAAAGDLQDPDFLKIGEALGKLSDDQLREVARRETTFFEERGGRDSMAAGGPAGRKRTPADKKAIVPIAMGIDATDRDLYNAVASLYRSVKTLETNIKKPKASDDGTGTG